MPKERLGKIQFEVHLAEHCNLNCRGCDHFSPLAKKELANLDLFTRDFQRLGKLFHGEAERILLVGGEPLLHPDIVHFLQAARNAFPRAPISIVSNGILLPHKDEEFWLACQSNAIRVVITKYPDIAVNHADIQEKAKHYTVDLQYFGDTETVRKTSYHLPLDLSGSMDAVASFEQCFHANECIMLREGRLYPCTVAPNIHHFNSHFGTNLPTREEDSIDIHSAKSGQEILEFLSRPIPFCRFCNVRQRSGNLPWCRSKKEISEWTIPASELKKKQQASDILKRVDKFLGRAQAKATRYLSPTYRLLKKSEARHDCNFAALHSEVKRIRSEIESIDQKREQQESVFTYKKHNHHHLEIHVTGKCVLYCPYCDHYCDIGLSDDQDCELVFASLRRWAKRLNPAFFRLLGGEPFMEKRLPDFISVIAQCFPQARREVVSNGVLIGEWADSLPRLLKDTGTALFISEHPMPPEHHKRFLNGLETARRWQRQYGVDLIVEQFLDETIWYRRYQGTAQDMRPFDDGKPAESRQYCGADKCAILLQDKLWQCPPLACLPLIADKLPNRNAWEPYLLYKPLEFSATDFELASFLHGSHGIEFCGMCPSRCMHANPSYDNTLKQNG